jgi:uncharacterized membrane protein
MLMRGLVIAAVAWPLLAGAAVWQRVSNSDHQTPVLAGIVYLVAGQVCHHRPERSFATEGVSWPVCARCAGLYLAAPFAAVLAAGRRRRLNPGAERRAVKVIALAAVPTVLTLLWEWGGLGTPSNLWRFTTALPLGAAVAAVLIQMAAGTLSRTSSGTLAGHGFDA